MPWNPLVLLLTLALGVISAQRLDSYLRKSFTDSAKIAESDPLIPHDPSHISKELLREFAETASSSAESMDAVPSAEGLVERKHDLLNCLYALSDCVPGKQSTQLLPYNVENVVFEQLRGQTLDNKSKYFYTEAEHSSESTEPNLIDKRPTLVDTSKSVTEYTSPEKSNRVGSSRTEARRVLPASHYNNFFQNLLTESNKNAGAELKFAEASTVTGAKRSGSAPVIGCDCKIKNDLLDLGQQHFPRYLLNAVCQTEQSPNEYPQKCWRGSYCKPLEYKVKVLTFRTILDHGQKDPALAWLPDDLRQLWKFKTVTVAAGCFCSY